MHGPLGRHTRRHAHRHTRKQGSLRNSRNYLSGLFEYVSKGFCKFLSEILKISLRQYLRTSLRNSNELI